MVILYNTNMRVTSRFCVAQTSHDGALFFLWIARLYRFNQWIKCAQHVDSGRVSFGNPRVSSIRGETTWFFPNETPAGDPP